MAGDAGADTGVRPSLSSPSPPSLLPELALTVLASPSPCTALTTSSCATQIDGSEEEGTEGGMRAAMEPKPKL